MNDQIIEITQPMPFRSLTGLQRKRLIDAWDWLEGHGLPFDVMPESRYRFAIFHDGSASIISGVMETREYDEFLWVQFIGVDVAYRRRGVGAELLHASMLTARDKGLRLGLGTHEVNTPMRHLALKLGLKPKDRVIEYWTQDPFQVS